MRVVFFHRKPRPGVNFSIENLFRQLRNVLPSTVLWTVKELSWFSEGFFQRLYIGIEAMFCQADINHITGDVHFIAIFLRGKKTVLTIHDIGPMTYLNQPARLVFHWFWILLPVRHCAVITTVSETTKLELLKCAKINPAKIKVVYNPVSAIFQYAPKVFNKAEPRILQIGTKANKNIIRLARALRGMKCVVEIVGEINADLEKELREGAINFVSSKNLSEDEMLEKYRLADILAFVSTYEGFGMPIVEANLVGRVVVTSNISSMPEVAGGSAQLVDPFDVNSIRAGIQKVIQDDAHREELIARGRENAKRFKAASIANQYANIYESLIRTHE